MSDARAIGEDMHRQMLERALADVMAYLGNEPTTDSELLHIEIGAAAGVNAAMRVLVERGWLRANPADELTRLTENMGLYE